MIETLVAATLGPAGAVATMLLVLIGIYRLSVSYAFPIAKEYVDNQAASMKEILTEHSKDRECFKDSIQILARRSDKLEDDVTEMKSDLRIIKDKVGV
jgi:hypothetical protein